MSSLSPLVLHSLNSPAETVVLKLNQLLNDLNLQLFCIINHSQEAQKSGLELPFEQLFIFGDPKTGTFLMQENPYIGLELPLKILIWQDSQNRAQIAYKNPLFLAQEYGIKQHIEILQKMRDALDFLIEKMSDPKHDKEKDNG
ncbi:MAG: hypothetical protein BGO14_04690 [Chlamydiales bacterium 38-26]|nr:DUF302 domain-containing protein [Chlamydiales bacterium]OJV07788.1 MAG: hypothetical protein BGO14_04690 [Chlamydiales bacterium 38-26]